MSGFSDDNEARCQHVCTDEDVKMLERQSNVITDEGTFIPLVWWRAKALLARLSAAEKVCYVLSNTKSIRAASAWDRLQEWESSKGGAGK